MESIGSRKYHIHSLEAHWKFQGEGVGKVSKTNIFNVQFV